MASAIPGGRAARYVTQLSSRRCSTLARSASKPADTALELHLPELEPSAGFLEEHLHLRLRTAELRRRRAQQVDALLEELERRVESDPLLLQRGQYFIETPKTCFETHKRELYD